MASHSKQSAGGLGLTGKSARLRLARARTRRRGAIRDAFLREVLPLIETDRVKPAADNVFRSPTQAAHACMASSAHDGKILLEA